MQHKHRHWLVHFCQDQCQHILLRHLIWRIIGATILIMVVAHIIIFNAEIFVINHIFCSKDNKLIIFFLKSFANIFFDATSWWVSQIHRDELLTAKFISVFFIDKNISNHKTVLNIKKMSSMTSRIKNKSVLSINSKIIRMNARNLIYNVLIAFNELLKKLEE